MSAAILLFGSATFYGLSGSTNLPRVVIGTYIASACGATPLLVLALVMIAVWPGL